MGKIKLAKVVLENKLSFPRCRASSAIDVRPRKWMIFPSGKQQYDRARYYNQNLAEAENNGHGRREVPLG